MILMRLGNQKAAINNKFSTKEQLCVLNTVNGQYFQTAVIKNEV